VAATVYRLPLLTSAGIYPENALSPLFVNSGWLLNDYHLGTFEACFGLILFRFCLSGFGRNAEEEPLDPSKTYNHDVSGVSRPETANQYRAFRSLIVELTFIICGEDTNALDQLVVE
jgi:hypothetical protein